MIIMCLCVGDNIIFFFYVCIVNFNFIVVFYNTKIKKFIFILTPVSFRLFSFFFSKQNQYFFSFIHSFSRENKKMNVHHLIIIIFFCRKQFNYHHIDTSSCLDTRQYCITMVVEWTNTKIPWEWTICFWLLFIIIFIYMVFVQNSIQSIWFNWSKKKKL